MIVWAYLGSDNAKFKITVEEEQRNWIQGNFPDNYSHENLMKLGKVTFNNLVENGDLKMISDKQPAKEKENKRFLALAAEILKKFKDNKSGPAIKKWKAVQPVEQTHQVWHTENPKNEQERTMKGTKMKWCTNDCCAELM